MADVNIERFLTNDSTVLTLQGMVTKYPDQWIFITNYELDERNAPATGTVYAACENKYVSDVLIALRKMNIKNWHMRTRDDLCGSHV